jgi:serine/threonine-protein kinase
MGEVWSARHLGLDVDVALKLTRADLLDATVRTRLVHEARILARLCHPSIVRVFDTGTTEDGNPYLVMELLRGPSLTQVLSGRGRLSPAAAVRLLLPVASALAAAHAQGVVHRDLKPDNIILVRAESGAIVPKVLDFGIAKSAALLDGALTREGALIGSPDYMSPEQAEAGADVDARTDVWSFCLVLYELVSGRQPYARTTLGETLRAILHDPLPVLEAPGFDDLALEIIVGRGLAKHRENRWQTMADLGFHLAQWAVARGILEDSAGAAIRSQWLSTGSRPLSEAPARLTPASRPPRSRRPSVRPAVAAARKASARARLAVVLLPVLLGLAAAAGMQLVGARDRAGATPASLRAR